MATDPAGERAADPPEPAVTGTGQHRRSGPPLRWRTALPLAVAAAGLLLAVSARSSGGTPLRSTSQNRLADLVAAQQEAVNRATAAQQRLSDQVDRLTAAQAKANGAVRQVQQQVDRLAGPAGLQPVHGPSLRVSLDDAPRDAKVADGYPPPTPDDLVVHQQDVQSVVNALWAGGAEAMTIMDQRVVATSAVRCVGNTLLLQGVTYSPPFVVTAVGDVPRMAKSLKAAPGVALFEQYVRAYGLSLRTATAKDTTLPGYQGPVTLTYASALPAGGGRG